MKKLLVLLLIIGPLFLSSFGLFTMNHGDMMEHGQCPFETAGITDCSQVQGPIDFVISHLNALSKFSLAIPLNSFTVSLALLLTLALAILFTFYKEFELFKFRPLLAIDRFQESFIPSNKILLNSWLALHENSPSFIGGR